METIDISGLDVVSYMDSTATHNFFLNKDINGLYKDKFNELLDDENIGNGSFRANFINNRIYSVSYDTTDPYEFGEYFAVEVAEAIIIAITTLAMENGGLEVISA